MQNKKIYTVLGVIVVGIALIVIFSGNLFSQKHIDLRVGHNIESVNHAPVAIATNMKLFEKHGISVEIIPLKSGKEVRQALAAGTIDVGSSGATNFFIPIANGAPVKIIGPLAASPTQAFVRPDGSVRTFQDLIGKTVAARLGSSSNIALGRALLKEGIDFKSITFVDIDSSFRPLALMDKKIVDLAIGGDYQEKIYEDAGAILFKAWVEKGYAHQTSPRTSLAVNINSLRNKKDAIGLFLDAILEAERFIQTNPSEAAQSLSDYLIKESSGVGSFSPEDILEAWKTVRYSAWRDPNDFVDLAQVAYDVGDIKTVLTLADIFDFTFREKLENAQHLIYE